MTKALFKKQMQEAFSWLLQDARNGKRRSTANMIGFGCLYILIFAVLGNMMYFMAESLCAPLVQMGVGWLYFSMMGLSAIIMGVVGSIFHTYAALYQAKDNDLLLSLPIPVGKILTMRLSGVYIMGLLYELLVMIPVLIVWFRNINLSFAGIAFSIILTFVLSIFIMTLSCILGWVVAIVSSYVKHKSLVTVVLSLGFFVLYYAFYAQAYKLLMSVLEHAEALANGVRSIAYPFYLMGKGAEGHVFEAIVFSGMVLLLFGVVYRVLSRSFLTLATTKRGNTSSAIQAKPVSAKSVDAALLQREWKHFLSSAVYMMNCGLGVIFIIAAGVILVVQRQYIAELLTALSSVIGDMLLPILAVGVCMTTTMNDLTAPSVSLEGKEIWIVQVLPVSGWQVLKAKLKLQLILTLVPVSFLLVCVEFVFRLKIIDFLLLVAVSVAFVCFMAEFGLVCNLKFPNLTWTSETVPVKQGMSVTLTLFGSWALVGALSGLYYLISAYIVPMAFMILVLALLVAGACGMKCWLQTKGTEIFQKL